MTAPQSTVSACLPGDRRGWGEPHSQSPVDSDDEGDVVGGKAHGREHDDHGDEPGLGDASCPDAGCGGCDAAGEGREHCWALGPRRRPECQSLWGQHCGAGIIRNATAGHSWGRGMPLPKVLWSQRLYPWPQQNVLRSLWKALCLGWEDPLEEGVATHSSILAWRIHGQRSLAGHCPCRSPGNCPQAPIIHWHWVPRVRLVPSGWHVRPSPSPLSSLGTIPQLRPHQQPLHCPQSRLWPLLALCLPAVLPAMHVPAAGPPLGPSSPSCSELPTCRVALGKEPGALNHETPALTCCVAWNEPLALSGPQRPHEI